MTTTDPFTDAARAEAEYRHPAFESPSTGRKLWPASRDSFIAGAEWARTHLAAQEPTDAEAEAAALTFYQAAHHRRRDHPESWLRLKEDTRDYYRRAARAALSAARRLNPDQETTR